MARPGSALLAVGLASFFLGGAVSDPARAQVTPPVPIGNVPVVLAVDTSRSLSSADLARVTGRLDELVDRLPASVPVGLLAFDDEPRWIARPDADRSAVREGLGGLRPQGDYTLLQDALFAATRELSGGGVIVLVTDGRDENSATTVEDIARRAEAQGVRIVTLGVGSRMEDRALRRLALLTDGRHLGSLGAVTVDDAASAVEGARGRRKTTPSAASSATRAASTEPPTPPVVGDAGRTAAEPETTATAGAPGDPPRETPLRAFLLYWGPILLVLLIAVGALVGLVLWLRSRDTAAATEVCPVCGSEELDRDGSCPACREHELQEELLHREVFSPSEAREMTSDTVVFPRLDEGEAIEKTRVLGQQSVLLVRERGEEQRAFGLGRLKGFAVGRDRGGNTLTLRDPALSSSHFKIVPDGEAFYVVDLGSTNGTWVDGRRVVARRIESGDVVRAGQTEFELKTKPEPLL